MPNNPIAIRGHFQLRLTGFAYLLATTFSLVAILQGLALLVTTLVYTSDNIRWNQAALGTICTAKPFDFTFYLLGCGILGLYSLFIYRLIASHRLENLLQLSSAEYPDDTTEKQIFRIWIFILANLLLGCVIVPYSIAYILLHILYWITLFQLPRIFSESPTPLARGLRQGIYLVQGGTYWGKQYLRRTIPSLLFAIIFIEYIYLFAPYFERPEILNDFLNIPETTLIDGAPIDNLKYIEEHHLMGLNPRYDPRRDGQTSPHLMGSDLFRLGVGGSNLAELFQTPGSVSGGSESFQDAKTGRAILDSIQQQENELTYQEPTQEEMTFLKKNLPEIHWQVMFEGMIHHQSHAFGPALEFDLGKPANEIYTQYGRLTIYLSWLLMFLLGGVSMGHLYMVSGLYYLLYFLFCVGVAWEIGRRWEYAAIVALSGLICTANEGFLLNYLIFGYNPIRHELDLPALFCAYLFFKNRSAWSLTALLSILFLAVFNDNVWGLMLVAGLLAALSCLALYEWATVPKRLVFVGLALMLGEALFGLKVHFGPDVSDYFFLGQAAYQAEPGGIFLLLFGIGCLAIFLSGMINLGSSPLGYTIIFWGIYCLGALLYPVWAVRWAHFWSVAPILGLFLFLIIKLVFETCDLNIKRLESYVLILMTGSLFILSGAALLNHHKELADYRSLFSSHKTYIWPYARASIESNINPDYLTDSVNLLDKYSHRNDVYILSQYDYLLTFLAYKYSAMPYSDMSHFLFTEEDNQTAINLLKKQKPEYLFVDRDVRRVMAVDIVSPDSWVNRLGMHPPRNVMVPDIVDAEFGMMYDRSVIRAFSINNLHSLFMSVEKDYEPVESSLLLTVYKRKETAP